MLKFLLTLTLFGSSVVAFPSNITLGLDSSISCQPTTWYDVTVFFIGNYIAHAATVKSYPGEATSRILIATIGALLIPTSGLIRGLNSIIRCAKFRRKGVWAALSRDPDYETAAASGSLVMVVRKKSWKPYPGDRIADAMLREESREVPAKGWALKMRNWRRKHKSRAFYEIEPVPNDAEKNPSRILKVYRGPWSEERAKWWTFTDTADEYVSTSKIVHGLYDFKDQEWSYALAHVPRDAVVVDRDGGRDLELSPRRLEAASTNASLSTQSAACERTSTVTSQLAIRKENPHRVIAASYSLPKGMIAIVQLAFAVVTLYQSSYNELNYFGYAAFGLTVIPYALMSFVNLLGNMLTPDYQALYLVSSDVMDEATRRGCKFDGVVGSLVPDTRTTTGTAAVLSSTPLLNSTDEPTLSFQTSSTSIPLSFSTSIIDYTTPSIAMYKRRKAITNLLETTYRDLSPSLFIPSCSKFLRHGTYSYPATANRTQMTHQGSFSLSSTGYSAWRNLICLINVGIVLGVIGGLTRFRVGQSTIAQQNWTLHWYIFGTVYSGFTMEDVINQWAIPEPDMGSPSTWWGCLVAVPLLLYGIPAIGGFVVVVQMLYLYGTCTFN